MGRLYSKRCCWSDSPTATPEELEQAHAYAYGGCIVQDMGYYPFSSRFFSDLTHYVRSGDFVVALIRDSQDLNEYAFALGALSHYAAEINGHSIATNLAVPILYPELRRKFGKTVTYWDNPLSHIRTEFGFDVLQVAQGRYAPDRYRAFIGFQVAKPVLERAFLDTYGIEMKDVFGDLDLALGSFRYSVGSIIPGMTRVAWQLKKDTLVKEIPGVTKKKFLYNLSRSSYEKNGGRSITARYSHPPRVMGDGNRSEVWSLQIARVPRADSGSRKDVHGELQRDGGQLPHTAGECGCGRPGAAEREFRPRHADVGRHSTREPIWLTTSCSISSRATNSLEFRRICEVISSTT